MRGRLTEYEFREFLCRGAREIPLWQSGRKNEKRALACAAHITQGVFAKAQRKLLLAGKRIR